MAKTYEFVFTTQAAEFQNGFVTVAYSLRNGPTAREVRTCTFKEALGYLPEFSAKAPGPHQAGFDLRNGNERAPAGYGDYRGRHCYKETA